MEPIDLDKSLSESAIKATTTTAQAATATKKGMSLSTKKFLVTLVRDAANSYLKVIEEAEKAESATGVEK